MPDAQTNPVTIVYWRDIPAQVIVGKGRRGAKVQLPERFEQAIDRCAMKVGAQDTDSYLAEWRKCDASAAFSPRCLAIDILAMAVVEVADWSEVSAAIRCSNGRRTWSMCLTFAFNCGGCGRINPRSTASF